LGFAQDDRERDDNVGLNGSFPHRSFIFWTALRSRNGIIHSALFFAWPPPSSVMNSRRFIMAPVLRQKIAHIGTAGDAVVRDFDRTNDR
jgi:hypothetical protein